MVCDKCEKNLQGVACPDVWKDGAKNTIESGGRKVGQNKLLSKNPRFNPYAKQTKCGTCKRNLQVGMYCQQCAYKKGLCSMCGVQILDVKNYRQTTW